MKLLVNLAKMGWRIGTDYCDLREHLGFHPRLAMVAWMEVFIVLYKVCGSSCSFKTMELKLVFPCFETNCFALVQ